MRRPLIAGNWKMHKTAAEAVALAEDVARAALDHPRVDVLVAPPYTALHAVADALRDSDVLRAAQDCHWAETGAFTGAISAPMVREHASHVILGHSERRAIFGDTDQEVNRKVHAALSHDLSVILCVGESEAERDAGETDAVVRRQLEAGAEGVASREAGRLTVAYEPVWAIGSGRACDADEAARVCGLLRSALGQRFAPDIAEAARLLYGGSVKPHNIEGYLHADDVDGALVGGASLAAESFGALIAAAAG